MVVIKDIFYGFFFLRNIVVGMIKIFREVLKFFKILYILVFYSILKRIEVYLIIYCWKLSLCFILIVLFYLYNIDVGE